MKRYLMSSLLLFGCTHTAPQAQKEFTQPAVRPLESYSAIISGDARSDSFHFITEYVDVNRDKIPEYVHKKFHQEVYGITFDNDASISYLQDGSIDATLNVQITTPHEKKFLVNGSLKKQSDTVDVRIISYYYNAQDKSHSIKEMVDRQNDAVDMSVKTTVLIVDKNKCTLEYEENYYCNNPSTHDTGSLEYAHCPFSIDEWDTHNNKENSPIEIGDCDAEEKIIHGIEWILN